MALSAPAPAEADLSVWARARSPELAADDDLITDYRRLMQNYLEADEQPGKSASAELYLKRARHLLEQGGAASSNNLAIRHALAHVDRTLFARTGELEHIERALTLLRPFARVSGHTLSNELTSSGLHQLGLCYAHLGRRMDEIDAYGRALEVEPHPIQRSLLLANQAEAWMSVGALASAIRGYRAAIQSLPSIATGTAATSFWGLAVALDRSGDHHAPWEQIAIARSYDPEDSQLKSANWFFMPAHDEHWYFALGSWSRARSAASPEERVVLMQSAIDRWRAYLAAAPSDDLWLDLAERRLRDCERELAAPRR